MNLIPWKNKSKNGNGISSFVEFRQEMDRMFDAFSRDPWGSLSASLGSGKAWFPAVDIAENDQEVIVHAEVPGVDPNELEITVTGNRLTLSGEKKETTERRDNEYYHTETRFGSFSRSMELPSGVDMAQVSAEHSNGVVTITLKKTAAATAKKIEVKTS